MIVLIGPVPPPGHGVSLMLAEFAERCRERGINISIVASNVPRDPRRRSGLGIAHLLRLLDLFWRSLTLCVGRNRRHRVCLICATKGVILYRDVALALLFRLLRRRFFVYIQGTELALYRGLARWVIRAAYSKADKIYCSESLRNLNAFINGRDCESHIVPNGVSDFLTSDIAEKTAAFDPAKPRILFLSNLYKIKGVQSFVETLCELRRLDVRFTAQIAGSYTVEFTQARMQEMLKEHGLADSVVCLGPVDDAGKREALRQSDILLFPSLRESFGNVVLEAMSAGVLVVASNTTSMDFILDSGSAGHILRPFRPAAAVETILRISEGDFAAKVLRARQQYTQLFSIDRYSAELALVLGGDKCEA